MIVRSIGRPVVLGAFERLNFGDIAFAKLKSFFLGRRVIKTEIAGGAFGDRTNQRQVTVTGPRAEVKQPVRRQRAVQTCRPRGTIDQDLLSLPVESESPFATDKHGIGARGQASTTCLTKIELFADIARHGIDHSVSATCAHAEDGFAFNKNCVGIVGEFLLGPQQRAIVGGYGGHVHTRLALDNQGVRRGHGQAGAAEARRGHEPSPRLFDQFADLRIRIGPDGVAGRSLEAAKMLVRAIKEDLIVSHGHRTRVDQVLLLVFPEDELVSDVVSRKGIAETPGHARTRVVAATQVSPTPATKGTVALDDLRITAFGAGHDVEDAVDEGHPLPLAVDARNRNAPLFFACGGVQHQASVPVQ